MYTDGHKIPDAKKLPLNLLDALRAYEKDAELQSLMGQEFSSAYLKLKHDEWNAYASEFSAWERRATLDI
jgi:glutamine synthetase